MKIILILLLFLVGLGCHDKCKNLDLFFAHDQKIQLSYFSAATGEPLIKVSNSLYVKSDINVFDENEKALPFTFVEVVSENAGNNFYQIVIDGIKSTNDYEKEICTKLYVDLKNDRDTLEYCYSVESTICGGSQVDYLNAGYNGTSIQNLKPDYYEYNILK